MDSTNAIITDSILAAYQKNYLDSLKKEYQIYESEDISLFPNPTKDFFALNSSEWNYENITSLTLVDILGVETTLKKERRISIAGYAPGNYFLKISYGSTIVTKRLIIL